VTKKPRKLPSGTTARAVPEWIGKSPDADIPKAVKLRIVLRQGGKCPISGKKFGPKAEPRFDHIKPLADGGEHRESNLQAIVDDVAHKPKTAREAAERAAVRARQTTHLGIDGRKKAEIKSRNDLARPKTESKITEDKSRVEKKQLPPHHGGIRLRDL
jgi:hypothetical protein